MKTYTVKREVTFWWHEVEAENEDDAVDAVVSGIEHLEDGAVVDEDWSAEEE